MPWICDCSPTKGKTEPASALLSPVARDYPNRALRRFFHAGGASTVPSKNRGNRGRDPGKVTVLFFTTYSPVRDCE